MDSCDPEKVLSGSFLGLKGMLVNSRKLTPIIVIFNHVVGLVHARQGSSRITLLIMAAGMNLCHLQAMLNFICM